MYAVDIADFYPEDADTQPLMCAALGVRFAVPGPSLSCGIVR
jgi:hypothetical protein